MRCTYIVCDGNARGKVVMNALDSTDRAVRTDVALCDFHILAMERWLKHYRPHLTPGGALYVGELDELTAREPS